MAREGDPAELCGRIYDGALDPLLWPEILEELAVAFDAICCHLFVGDLARDEVFLGTLNSRFSLERAEQYHAHYRHIDDRLLLSMQRPKATVYADPDLISSDEFVRTEFYNDFYAPHGLRWSMVGMPIREDGLAAGFSIHRPPEADGFDRSDVQRLQALFPHLARACRLMRRTAQVGALATAGAAALDRLPAAIFILDRTGLPLFYNRAAQRVIDQADGLALSPRGFAAARPGEARQLRRAIGEASNGSADRTGIGATVAVSRPSGLRSYQVTVVPLGRAARHARFPVQSRAAAMVIVSDPETEPTLPEEALVRLFGFTPTEAQLAVRLAQGASPKEIAEATQRSPNTVRWMLRNVLAKTDCRRQIDLVRLLRSAALTLVLEDGSPDETGV